MKFVAVALLIVCGNAAPTNPNALEPVLDNKPAEENPSEMMLELMKAMMAMQQQENEGEESGLGDLTGFMSQATDLMQELGKGDMNDPQHLQSTMMGAAMKMAASSGIAEKLDMGKVMGMVGELASGNPTNAVMSLMDLAVQHSGLGLKHDDPLIKLAKSGARTMINGEVAPDDNPFQHLHDVVAPTVSDSNKDNALMELILDSIKAAADDTSGDPLNAIANYVLEHPKALANPIVSNAKTIHETITNEDLHHTSPLISSAKSVMGVMTQEDIHEKSDILKLIASTVADPSSMAASSPLVKAAADIHSKLLNADPSEQQGHMMNMVKTFTEKVTKGEANGLEDVIASHPAGKAFAEAAEALQGVIEDPLGSGDTLIGHGLKAFEAVTGDGEPTDPVLKTAKEVHDTLSNIDANDPLIKAATTIQEHVTSGLDEWGGGVLDGM